MGDTIDQPRQMNTRDAAEYRGLARVESLLSEKPEECDTSKGPSTQVNSRKLPGTDTICRLRLSG